MLLSGRCIYETRGVATTGQVTTGNADSVMADVDLDEQRDADPDKNMSWNIRGTSLFGHVSSIELVDNTAKSVVLYTFPVNTDTRLSRISYGYVQQTAGAKLNGFFDLLSKNRGLILIRTNIPGRSVIEVPLTVTRKSDWNRPYCS
jgi:hypothetical protein